MKKQDWDSTNCALDVFRDIFEYDQIGEFLISFLNFTFASDLYDLNSFLTGGGEQSEGAKPCDCIAKYDTTTIDQTQLPNTIDAFFILTTDISTMPMFTNTRLECLNVKFVSVAPVPAKVFFAGTDSEYISVRHSKYISVKINIGH